MLGRERYYVDEGQGHDELLRCKDCQALVTFDAIKKIGGCDQCGNKRFNEISLLTEKEMADIRSGKIDFKFRELFLEEFEGIEA